MVLHVCVLKRFNFGLLKHTHKSLFSILKRGQPVHINIANQVHIFLICHLPFFKGKRSALFLQKFQIAKSKKQRLISGQSNAIFEMAAIAISL